MATTIALQVNTVTETSISITMAVEVTYAATYKIRYGITGTGGDPVSETYWSSNFTLPAGGSTNQLYKNFTGLMPGESYRIWCELWNATTNTNLGVTDETYVSTNGESRPPNWAWYSNIAPGAFVQCEEIAAGHYAAYYIGAQEWNDFFDRINAFRRYCGLQDYAYTPAVPGEEMTRVQANQAWTAIWQCPYRDYPLPEQVQAGDELSASFFEGLALTLNSIYR